MAEFVVMAEWHPSPYNEDATIRSLEHYLARYIVHEIVRVEVSSFWNPEFKRQMKSVQVVFRGVDKV